MGLRMPEIKKWRHFFRIGGQPHILCTRLEIPLWADSVELHFWRNCAADPTLTLHRTDWIETGPSNTPILDFLRERRFQLEWLHYAYEVADAGGHKKIGMRGFSCSRRFFFGRGGNFDPWPTGMQWNDTCSSWWQARFLGAVAYLTSDRSNFVIYDAAYM